MSGPASYEVWVGRGFDMDYRRLDAAARNESSASAVMLRRLVLRAMLDLSTGKSDGHHPLGFELGKGDLRDCVTAYVQSDPERKADHRLVFREAGPVVDGELPRRELLAVKPRRGPGDVYEHVCARLGRHPSDRQPGLNRFGDRAAGSGGNQAQRQAELDTKRAIAHAWAGQQPLASSRPLALSGLTSVPRTTATAQGRVRTASRGPVGHPSGPVGPRR